MLIVKHIVSLPMVFTNAQSPIFAKFLSICFPIVFFLGPRKNDYFVWILFRFGCEIRPQEWYFACKLRIEEIILICCFTKNKKRFLIIIQAVKHRNKSTSCHKRIISCLVTTFLLKVLLYKLEIYVGIGCQHFFVETWFV